MSPTTFIALCLTLATAWYLGACWPAVREALTRHDPGA